MHATRTVLVACLLGLPIAHSEPLTFQQTGRLLDSAGAPINGVQPVVVSMYDSNSDVVWQAAFASVPFEQGYYGVVLGTDDTGRTLEQATTGSDAAVEIGVAVASGNELVPRSPMHGVPRAAVSDAVTSAPGVLDTPCIGSDGGMAFDPTASTLTVCMSGTWLPVLVDTTAKSCAHILARNVSATSGTYNIDPDGILGSITAYDVDCDMDTDNGGWTKVANHAGGTATSYFWSSSRWFDSRTTAGSRTVNTADFVSYAAFDVPASAVMAKRSSGSPVFHGFDTAHSGQPLTHWMSAVDNLSSTVMGAGVSVGRVYTNQVGLFMDTTKPESEAMFGVTFGSEYIGQLRIFAYDRSGSGDPWHMWHGVQATITATSSANGCTQLPSPWTRRALHPNGITDVCYASSSADHMSIWVR
ncbi:MAG: hypothetical protein ACJATT_000660 [Myxococcota bacterium]|jgi:hypothetical protein